MGANLILASLGARVVDGDGDDVIQRLDEAAARLCVAPWRRSVDRRDVPEALREQCDGDDRETNAESYWAAAVQSCEDVKEAIQQGYRDVCSVDGGGDIVVWLSGSMTWGDSPGETYEAIERVLASGCYEDPRYPDGEPSNVID